MTNMLVKNNGNLVGRIYDDPEGVYVAELSIGGRVIERTKYALLETAEKVVDNFINPPSNVQRKLLLNE